MSFDANAWLNQLYSVPAGTPGGVGAVDAYGKNVGAAMAEGGLGFGNAGLRMTNSYLNEYQPYDRKFMNYVDNIGTDDYRAQQRGRAMTDVNMQAGQQMQAANRNMARMGVNPNSAQFATMNGLMAQQNALNKVTAAMGADRSARDEWAKGLGAINAMGIKTGELGIKSGALAADMGKVGMVGADLGASAADRQTQAGAAATSAGAASMNASTNATKAAQDMQLGLGKLALERYLGDRQWDYQDRALQNRIDAGSFGNTFLSQIGGGLATGIGTGLNNAFQSWIKNPGGGSFTPYYQDDGSFSVVPGGSFMPSDIGVGSGGYIDVLGLG